MPITVTRLKVFPIYQPAADDPVGNWVNSSPLGKMIWLRVRPEDFIWYGVGAKIVSRNEVELRVHCMKDSCWGGLGKETHRQTVTEFTPEERALIDEMVEARKLQLAAVEYVRRQRAEEEAAIKELAREIRWVE